MLITGFVFLPLVRVNVPWARTLRPTAEERGKVFPLSLRFLLWRFVMMLMLASNLLILEILENVELGTT